MIIGAISCGRRKVCLIERSPSAAITRRLVARPPVTDLLRLGWLARVVALEVVAGLGDEDVVERRLDEVERLDREPGVVERAHDRGDLGGAGLELDQRDAVARRAGTCRSAPGSRRPARAAASATLTSRWGRPISALSDPGVPSATILPLSMIPTRSASLSASSRYWVVRKTVVPSSLSFSTSSQIDLRLTGSRPVVGSSRKRTRGSWTSAEARSRRRRIPPE